MADLAVSIPVTAADPNKDAAVLEKSTLESLRHVQHKDSNGNVISMSSPLLSRFGSSSLTTLRSRARSLEPYSPSLGKTSGYHQII
jgi:hypothetical protein